VGIDFGTHVVKEIGSEAKSKFTGKAARSPSRWSRWRLRIRPRRRRP